MDDFMLNHHMMHSFMWTDKEAMHAEVIHSDDMHTDDLQEPSFDAEQYEQYIQYDPLDHDSVSTPESSNTPDTPGPMNVEPMSESKSQNELQHIHSSSSVASATSPEGSMTDPLDVNAANHGGGLPTEVIASYITGPDTDGKWRCTFEGCDRKFGRKENIKSHIQTHLNDRQFECPDCHKCFVRQHDLRRHYKTHSGEKNFKCPCGTGFVRQDALTRHRQRGMCRGAFDGYPKKTGKRGRPRKQRPENESAKITKPRQKRAKNLSVSSMASYYSQASSILDSPTQINQGMATYDHLPNMASSAPMPMASPEALSVYSQSLPQQQLQLPPQFLTTTSPEFPQAMNAAFATEGLDYFGSDQVILSSPTDADFLSDSPEFLGSDPGYLPTDPAQLGHWFGQP